ncbi:MAG: riboflavin synthase [Chloroflexi bacterium]|nr:riboflavin synthase [Chloroflexota bacterium]MDE2863420.1 riboflavin synthase [Chloroflexota bacterium]MXW27462.1 riboflavin synthase [Chloroflexota bacterium]MXX65700.1 riboflavin synthase [Chloroflexota bacterium]MXY01042.1 riboflavin synthase [Chloroflexota bacterium]
MFTGLVEEVGRVERARSGAGLMRLSLRASFVDELQVGESVAVAGACLTVVEIESGRFTVEIVDETRRRTNLGTLQTGRTVNLERALRADSRLGGHFVQAHVDCTATVRAIDPDGESQLITFSHPPQYRKQIVEKGYVAVDGVSLTVVESGPDWFKVALIPHTRSVTTLGELTLGTNCNLETDVLAKYVVALAESTATGL